MIKINDNFEITPGSSYVLHDEYTCTITSPGRLLALTAGSTARAEHFAAQSEATVFGSAAFACVDGALAISRARFAKAYAWAGGSTARADVKDSIAEAWTAGAIARAKVKNALVYGYQGGQTVKDFPETELTDLEKELNAWKSRFPEFVYRPQDDCVALKLN